jgi:multidrug resistance protein, MATE family
VLALFIVGAAEYIVVWLGTDWDLEVEKGMERNRAEALRQQTSLSNEAEIGANV